MTRRNLIILAAFGSVALLAGAFLFQFAGYAPCELCLWQRWPHAIAAAFGLIAVIWSLRPSVIWPLLGCVAMIVSIGLAAFHTGVERKWWDGLQSCSGQRALGADLLSTEGADVILCDQITWQLFGLSMANYNLVYSLALAGLWIMAARR